MSNNQFGEKIILLKKEKICPSINAKTDEFFKKMVAFNILSLWLYKEVVLQAINATFYDNYHSFIAKLSDIFLLVKYIINDSIFKKKLGYTGMLNNTIISTFPNLFYIGSTHLSNNIALSRYVDFA